LVVALTLTVFARGATATVTTDQLDYAPYTYVKVTGTGFLPGETVQLTLAELDANGSWVKVPEDLPDWPNPWISDQPVQDKGTFIEEWYVYSEAFIGVSFKLTAVGLTSNESALTTFTDSSTQVTFATSASGLPSGVSVNVSYNGINNG